MKHFAKSATLMLALACCASAQHAPGGLEDRAENLRSQLRGAIDKQAELQSRLQQIDEDLKPENIQRSIALIGTTRPEELREQRRQQLERDKAGVQAQLEQLATSRARLEASINTAEAEADRQRMRANTPPPPDASPGAGEAAPAATTTRLQKMTNTSKRRTPRRKMRRHTPAKRR